MRLRPSPDNLSISRRVGEMCPCGELGARAFVFSKWSRLRSSPNHLYRLQGQTKKRNFGLTLYPPYCPEGQQDVPRLQRSSRRAPDTDVKASDRLYGPGDGIPRV